MKRILIVGAGDFGRELFCWMTTDPRHGVEWEVDGFLDDNTDALSAYPHYPTTVTGSISEYSPAANECLVMAIASPASRMKIADRLKARGAEFTSWIHPSVIESRFHSIGRGCVIGPNSVISCDVSIGNFVIINLGVAVGHDAKIGDGCTINSHCDITGHVSIGQGTFLGSSVSIIPHVTIGSSATIGAGSTVVRRVRDGSTVMGDTAKRISWSDAEAA